MNVARILDDLQAHGCTLRIVGDGLRLQVPPGRIVPPAILELARAHRDDLRRHLLDDRTVHPHPVRVDAADPEERTALVQHDGGVPAAYAGAFAALQQSCPAGVPRDRWHQFVNDAGRFLDAWGPQAHRMGWTAADLFGLHPDAPMARNDCLGLCWLLKGQTVRLLDSGSATLQEGLVYRRHVGRGP